jgi:hypothetical protein
VCFVVLYTPPRDFEFGLSLRFDISGGYDGSECVGRGNVDERSSRGGMA